MVGWPDLDQELDAWAEGGRTATLWWRDDDATRVTSALEHVLTLSTETGTPVGLAVIPRDAEASLARRLEGVSSAYVLCHGFGHVNHAPPGADQDEYGIHRTSAIRLAELAEARRRLAFFPRTLPILVPPWNRMDEMLLPHLPEVGIAAVSGWGSRPLKASAPEVARLNVHVDIINWAHGGFIGESEALAQVIRHLGDRRRGAADPVEPTGIMSHHGWHDEGCWWFLGTLIQRTSGHSGACWVSPLHFPAGSTRSETALMGQRHKPPRPLLLRQP